MPGLDAGVCAKAGDLLTTPDGLRVPVQEACDAGVVETVYNWRIADHHTYFVSADEWAVSVWAHNTSCDSKKLGKALKNDGQPNLTIDGQAAHVVPTGEFSARSPAVQQAINDARAALESAGIPINSAENGFWATAGHNGTHTDAFFLQLGKRMNDAVAAGTVSETLNAIRSGAMRGAFIQ